MSTDASENSNADNLGLYNILTILITVPKCCNCLHRITYYKPMYWKTTKARIKTLDDKEKECRRMGNEWKYANSPRKSHLRACRLTVRIRVCGVTWLISFRKAQTWQRIRRHRLEEGQWASDLLLQIWGARRSYKVESVESVRLWAKV